MIAFIYITYTFENIVIGPKMPLIKYILNKKIIFCGGKM